jgi:ubiquinone/menaquinone biosynthesis C-methylase UbiE
MTKGGSFRPSGSFFQLDGDHVQRYVWAGQHIRGLKILDAGCGHGYGSEYLADGLAKEVVGIDSDSKAIQFARRTYHAYNLSFHLMDANNLRFDDESFDAAISFEVIEHLHDVDTYLRELRRVLKSGGVLLLSTPNRRFHERFSKDGKPLSRFHVHEFYPEELLHELQRYFLTSGIYYLSGKNDEALYSYFHSCNVPRWARNLVPLFLKDAWLRFRGIPSISRDIRGRWTDFEIDEVDGVEEIGPNRAVQLFKCIKK